MRIMKTTHQSLIFPLNVYAELLELAFGQVDFLSYGLQAEPGLSIVEAQQAMTTKLLAMLEHGPGSSVLDVGCGTGMLAQQLMASGYQVTAIDANEAAIAAARQRFASEAPLALAELQAFEPDQRFDVLILQNSARYQSPLTVFAHARRLLKAGGQLLIQEEFTGDDAERVAEPLPVLTHVVQMAGRAGFELTQQHDVSVGVGDWLQRCLPLLEQHMVALTERTGLSTQMLSDLRQSMSADLSRCRSGRYVHALLSFRMEDTDVTLLPAEALPIEQFRSLFENSFDTDFSAELWHWKYGQGRGHSVVACKQGEAVAHYGGISRDILYFGAPEQALQICDVMVLPQHRSFYSRSSLFFLTAATMLELHAGNTRRHLLGFGFPNLKAMHVAQRLKLYAKTDELMALSFPPGCFDTNTGDDAWTVASGSPDTGDWKRVDVLWQQMALAFTDGIVGLRNAHYLFYRYVQRPGLDYQFHVISHTSGEKAVAVTRDHGEGFLIMDIITADKNMAAALQALCRHGHDIGRPMIFWLSAGQQQRFQATGLQADATGIHIPCNAWTQGPSAEKLQGKWWLTAGDMDFL
jgi:SAM-dependent methyltransferase